jgi:geranylgeranyl diphosphate synthase type II
METFEAELQAKFRGVLPEDTAWQAAQYSISDGGKRIRPRLLFATALACGADGRNALPLAVALEMVHTYSLIHDDLPCMDDDDLRRGKPSCHIMYGEATALLAGDALLTEAFAVIADSDLPGDTIADAVLCLAVAAGHNGMILGQVLDMAFEESDVDSAMLQRMNALKTGRLIIAAGNLGWLCGSRTKPFREAFLPFFHALGVLFQVADDILDVISTEEDLGKPIGSDAENSKTTWVSLMGVEKAKGLAKELYEKAQGYLRRIGDDTQYLSAILDTVGGKVI